MELPQNTKAIASELKEVEGCLKKKLVNIINLGGSIEIISNITDMLENTNELISLCEFVVPIPKVIDKVTFSKKTERSDAYPQLHNYIDFDLK